MTELNAQRGAKWRCIAIYYVFACGISWTLWLPVALGRDGLNWLRISPPFPVVVSIGTIGPLLAGYISGRSRSCVRRAVRLLPRQRFRFAWLFLAPLLVLFCFFAVLPALITRGGPLNWNWHPSALAGIVVPMFNYNLFGGPLFEEFGWRGFLQVRLQTLLPPWIAAVCVRVLWAAWHLPLFLFHGWTSASLPVYFLITIGLSLTMAYGFNASGKSVVAAILMHSAFNSSPRFLDACLHGTATREHPSAEWFIAASFLLVGVALIALTRGNLAADRR